MIVATSTPAPVVLHGGSTSVIVDVQGGVPRILYWGSRLSDAASTYPMLAAFDPAAEGVAEQVQAMTEDRGADVVIEMSGAYQALQEAARTVGYSSRVVAGGFFQGDGEPLRLGEEFHHNRVAIVGSQISGVAPQLRHRWDELRMSRTALQLAEDGRLSLASLVTHVLPDTDAPVAFEMLDGNPHDALQVVLDYGAAS